MWGNKERNDLPEYLSLERDLFLMVTIEILKRMTPFRPVPKQKRVLEEDATKQNYRHRLL